MSWSQWGTAPMPAPTSSATATSASVPSAPSPMGATTGVSYTAAVQAPASYTPAQYAALSPEQQLALQQNWQQWQTYHQQYAQWHAQYGEQYQREMQAKLGIAAPTIPFIPTIAPYVAPVPPTGTTNYSIPPPPPTQTTSVMNNPNICAVAANPPPPPPPPPPKESNDNTKPQNPQPSSGQKGSQGGNNFGDRFPGRQMEDRPGSNQGQQNNQRQFQNQRSQQQQQQQSWRTNNESRGYNDRRGGYGNDRGRDNYGDNFNRGGRGRDRGRDRDRDGDRGRFDNDRSGRNVWQSNSQNQQQFGGNSRQEPCGPQNQQQFGVNSRQEPFGPQNKQQFGGNSRQEPFGPQNQQQFGGTSRQELFGNSQYQSQSFGGNQCQENFGNSQSQSQNYGGSPHQQNIGNSQSQNIPPKGSIIEEDDDKTPEERAFDEQFKKWEEEFENWKRQNANHPDKKAYKEYEMKFEDCRRKLLERREVMRRRKMERKMKEEQERRALNCSNSPAIEKTPAVNEDIKKETLVKDDQPTDEKEIPEKEASAESNSTENVFLTGTKLEAIPGLDLVESDEKGGEKPNEVTEVIDLDAEGKRENSAEKNTPVGPGGSVSQTTESGILPTGPEIENENKDIPSLMSQKVDMPAISPASCKTDPNSGNNLRDQQEENKTFSNQSETNESFGKFLENNRPNIDQRGNEFNSFGNHSERIDGNMSHGISDLANALSDPNVLALITAAIGNNGCPGSGGNFNSDMDRRGGLNVSPWMSGLEPYQNQNHFNNRRNFGSNAGIWQDNQTQYNSPWVNRNMQDNRWGNQGNQMRQDDFRRGNSRWQNDTDDNWRNQQWQDDNQIRSHALERNNAPPNLVDERSRSSERFSDKDKANPFKDQDDRGSGRFNPFSGNDRGRHFNRDDHRGRSRSNNSGNSRDRSRSSGRSSRHDGSTTSGNRRNPFKTELSVFDKNLNSPFGGRVGECPQQRNEPFFRPTRVIDYQNRPLGMENENNDVLLPTKVVDYGHGGGNVDGIEERNDFLPMTTIDYGHASAKAENPNPIQNQNPVQGQNLIQNQNPIQNQNLNQNLKQNQNQMFNEGRNRRRNRNRNRNRVNRKMNFFEGRNKN